MKKFATIFLAALVAGMTWNFFYPELGNVTAIGAALESPFHSTIFGRDSLGRDLFPRILQGAQVSVFLGLASSLMAFLLGVLYGGLAAFSHRWLDQALMRVSEVFMSLPSLMLMAVLAVSLQAFFFRDVHLLLFWVLALGSWMPTARLTRNLILSERKKEYIEAAEAIGASPWRQFRCHLLPNLKSSLLVAWSLQVPQALLAEGLLSFLGFGVKSPFISWGALLQEGWKTLSNFPHLFWAPSLILFLTIFSLNLLLEDLRRALDHQLKWDRFS